MKELNFQEWIIWAKTTNSLGAANVEPTISKFLETVEKENNSLFIGKTWNGSNWENVSNSYRNLLTVLLLKNPQKDTYAGVLGRSILELDYHGIDSGLLEEALEIVPEEQWRYFCEKYLPNQKKEALSFANKSGIEKLNWVYKALVQEIHEKTESEIPAKAFEEYLNL